MPLLKTLTDSKLFIALGALLLCMESQIQFGMTPSLHPYIFVVFFATIIVYNIPRLIARIKNPNPSFIGLYIILIFTFLGLLLALILTRRSVMLALIPVSALTLAYSIPIYKRQNKYITLRSIPYFKIFIISFVWSTTTVLLPFLLSQTSDYHDATLIFVERFLFIFSITLPFDVRDLEADQKNGLKTLAMLGNAGRITYYSLFLFFIAFNIHYCLTNNISILFSMNISFIFTLFCLSFRGIKKLPLYHEAILDGAMHIQAMFVLISNII